MRVIKAASIGIVALLAVACGGITIPSIPPIPSFALPSGGTLPPGVIPSASGTCAFISPEEISAAMGNTATLTSVSDTECSYTFANFSTVNVSIETSTDLQAAKFLFGSSSKDITVAGLPAVTGIFIGQPGVYVQKGSNQLQILGILTGTDDATVNKLIAVATIAASHWPG